MEDMFEDFIIALRNIGVRVSVSESIDAMNAVKIVSIEDKEILRDSLLATLSKSKHEKELFNECFDRFFSYNRSSINEQPAESSAEDTMIAISPLAQMLLSGNNTEIEISMREAARAVDITGIRFLTQKGLYIQRILNHIGFPGLNEDIEKLYDEGVHSSIQIASRLEKARESLLEDVKNLIEQHFSLYSGLATDEITEWYLRNAKLSNAEEQDYERLHAIIQKIVKKLNDIYSRRRKSHRRGQFDFKKTIRKNLIYQGFIFDPWWKFKKIDRPDIVAICDISRSVKAVVRFFLLFLYSLNKIISKIRIFIFCSNLVEVSHIFDEYPIEEALARIQSGAGLPIQLGPTDYGRALSEFKENWLDIATKKTTVIILGDARNNYGHPHREILKQIYQKCKRLIWLNPEQRSLWSTGDSEMKGYLPYCHLSQECNTINHLEKLIREIIAL